MFDMLHICVLDNVHQKYVSLITMNYIYGNFKASYREMENY